MAKLTSRQQAFCEEYLIDLNALQAAIRAGYSEKTAKQIGSENLSKPDVAKYIAELKAERSLLTKIDAAWVLMSAKKVYEPLYARRGRNGQGGRHYRRV
jgi:phage terminase small subunit